MKGFTLIEVLLALAIVILLVFITLPLGINFYKRQQLDSIIDEITQALRRAQLKASSQADYSFGVYFGSGYNGAYVLF